MKESKNTVFAIKSYLTNPDGTQSHDGYLLFPEKVRAQTFMQMAASIVDPKQKAGSYEEHDYVKVSDYVAGRVHDQKHYFVRDVEVYVETADNDNDSAEGSAVQELSTISPTNQSSDSLVQSVKEMEEMENLEEVDVAVHNPQSNSGYKP